MRRRPLTPALVLLTALVSAAPGLAGAPEDPRLSAFEGHWTRSGRAAEDAARSANIDALAENLPVWYRALARTLMKASMQPDEQYRIRAATWGLEVEVDAEKTWELRVGAPPRDDGRRTEFVDDAIAHDWRHSETSYGTTTWRVLDDGRLRIDVEAFDARLRGADDRPLPIRYTTTYSRAAVAISAPPPE